MPVNINGVSSSANLQQLQNVNNDLPTEEEVKKASEKPVAEEVQKPDSAKVKEEAASLVQKKDGLGEKSAEKFAAGNKVETAKNDETVKDLFDKNPCAKIVMIAIEQIMKAIIDVLAKVSSKLPKGVGDMVTGALSMVKGYAAIYKLDDSKDENVAEFFKEISDGAAQVCTGLLAHKGIEADKAEESDGTADTAAVADEGNADEGGKKPTCLAAKIISSIGTMCSGLSEAKDWQSAVGVLSKAAVEIAQAKIADDAEKSIAPLKEKIEGYNKQVADLTEQKDGKKIDDEAFKKAKAEIESQITDVAAQIKEIQDRADEKIEIATAVDGAVPGITKVFARGFDEIKAAVNASNVAEDAKILSALARYKTVLLKDPNLSEDDKKLVAVLSDGAIRMVEEKGAKKTLDALEDTFGAVSTSVLTGRNKEVAEQMLAMSKKIRASGDKPFEGIGIVLESAKEVVGDKFDELGALQRLVGNAEQKANEAVAEQVAKESAEVKEKADSEAELDVAHMS